MSKLILAALSVALTATAGAQCLNPGGSGGNFDNLPPNFPIDSIPGWSDQSPGAGSFTGTNPDNNTTAIVLSGSETAKVRLNNIGLGSEFTVAADVTIYQNSAFRLICPAGFQGGNYTLNYRVKIGFDVNSATPHISYDYFGNGTPSATLPLNVGVPTRLEVVVNTAGNVVTYFGGEILAVEPWSAGPSACPVPESAAWLSLTPGTSVIIDDVCSTIAVGAAYCAANPNSSGLVSELRAAGTASLAANDLVLTTTNIPSNTWGYYLVSANAGFTANPGGSLGNLCLDNPIGRYTPAMLSGPNGVLSMAVDWTSIPQPTGPVAAMAGDVWCFQMWHRDSMGGAATSNFSQGLEIMVISG